MSAASSQGGWKELALGAVFLVVVGTVVTGLIGLTAWIVSAF